MPAIFSESTLILPIGVHHIDFLVPIPIRREEDLCLCVNAYHQRCQTQAYNAS